MCLVRERLLLGENAGYNAFRESHLGAGLAAMFPGLPAADCTTLGSFECLLERSLTSNGPVVICAELADVEVPPFTPFRERAPAAATVVREVDDA
jgi:acetolactate synthase-1/2/3 large subunit